MEAFLGTVLPWAPTYAPRGWAFCQGQILPIAQNSALFALLGTTYGGNGQTTFALPDLRGRIPLGAGQGPGTSNYTLGEMAGNETVTLTQAEMPQHIHPIQVTPSTLHVSSANADTAVAANGATIGTAGVGAGRDFTQTLGFNSLAPDVTLNAASVTTPTVTEGVAGGSQPHNNLQPFLSLNFIICLEGIFPSRN